FLHAEKGSLHLKKNQHRITLPLFTFHTKLPKLRKNQKEIALKSIFIDQSELTPKIYNCLKRSQEDLMKIEHFCLEDVKHILGIFEVEKHFTTDLPKKKF
ncbi:unnamed protein product, partial [Linum tenue]